MERVSSRQTKDSPAFVGIGAWRIWGFLSTTHRDHTRELGANDHEMCRRRIQGLKNKPRIAAAACARCCWWCNCCYCCCLAYSPSKGWLEESFLKAKDPTTNLLLQLCSSPPLSSSTSLVPVASSTNHALGGAGASLCSSCLVLLLPEEESLVRNPELVSNHDYCYCGGGGAQVCLPIVLCIPS